MEYYQVLALTAAVLYHAEASKGIALPDENGIKRIVATARLLVETAALEQKGR
jgi:hypothetical protein